MLHRVESRGSLKDVEVSREGTSISHLLFADYCLIFCKAELDQWRTLEGILNTYEMTSG